VRVLKDINTTIKKGSFTMIVGDIGSGKSSLLMAILNEMVAGGQASILINGSIAYSSQKPWIMSATVRDNITFESPYNEDKFNRVLHYASLE
jgi:ABC-type multidrug transport system fused ATPase/permease subunit